MNARFEARSWSAMLLAVAALAVGPASVAAEADKKAEPSTEQLEQKLEAARARLDEAASEVAELSMSLSDDVIPNMRWFPGPGQKAMLGINLGAPNKTGPEDGAEIVSVSPGGAAAEAGLKARDVLVEVNGKSLKRDADGVPRDKLLRQLRGVDPGEKVTVSYRRDGKVAKATLTAKPFGDHLVFHGAVPARPAMTVFGPNMTFVRAAGVFGSAELVPLTPKLGQYFGTDKGLLVVRAPEDSRLQLEEGDVIVDIDGRTPSSPSHALRILSSYQAGEKLKLNVLRAKKKLAFDITIPEETWQKRFDGAHFMQDDDVLVPALPSLPASPGGFAISVHTDDESV